MNPLDDAVRTDDRIVSEPISPRAAESPQLESRMRLRAGKLSACAYAKVNTESRERDGEEKLPERDENIAEKW
jgi:hypothetical protein